MATTKAATASTDAPVHDEPEVSQETEEQREQDADEKAAEEEEARRKAGFDYANKVHGNNSDPLGIEEDADQENAAWLMANGYAEMHSIQEGVDTYNYILLTKDGVDALSTYNSEAVRD